MQPQPTDTDIAVVLRGEGEPQTTQGLLRRLQAFEDEGDAGQRGSRLHAHGHPG